MLSRMDILMGLRRDHNEQHKTEEDPECPFCQRIRENTDRLVSGLHEGALMHIVETHMARWEREGVRIANAVGAHTLPAKISVGVLSEWVKARIQLPDAPEDYLDHPLVLELFHQQKNQDTE